MCVRVGNWGIGSGATYKGTSNSSKLRTLIKLVNAEPTEMACRLVLEENEYVDRLQPEKRVFVDVCCLQKRSWVL